MTDLKEKLYQMFILGFDGEYPSDRILDLLEKGLGGVILFTQNIKTKAQTKLTTKTISQRAKYFPFISTDEEGGRVERTENLFDGKKFLSARYAKEKGEEYIITQTREISKLLKELGFNLNFAPVLDVNTNPNNPIIGERAFSDNTDEVIKFGNLVVKEYIKNGIAPCTKHFPGHGDANSDSHLTLPEINLDFEDLETNHIRAFKEVQSPMVMVAHLYCKAFDDEKIPSSVSKNVLGYLKKIAPNSLIITDDMEMKGICKYKNPTDNIINAVLNGVNLILYRSSDDKTIQIIENVYKKALNNPDLQEKISSSFDKIIEFKKNFLPDLKFS